MKKKFPLGFFSLRCFSKPKLIPQGFLLNSAIIKLSMQHIHFALFDTDFKGNTLKEQKVYFVHHPDRHR